ncbi:AEC family transporter [Streptococcus ovuberis]|uniref:Permease n=1 Tax=Streptococcus ovuberis TaxID=1936207 RepID=A0A7X6MYD5_9STRE|nr:AEC family transporter [Streptococcus ovuberis]NKZ20166.1 permease [Streptococcus ovuberis]
MLIASMVFQKLIVLFCLMAMGYYLAKKEILTPKVTRQLSKLLTTYVAPSLFISSFLKADYSLRSLQFLLLTIGMAFGILGSRILVVRYLMPRKRAIDTYAVLFANVGFLGTPLAFAVGGQEAVFYISGFVVANQILQWTYGIYLLTGDRKRIALKNALINPASISTAIGLILFMFPYDLPTVASEAIASFALLNTPLSTLVLGTYFYKASWTDVFCYLPAYWTAFLRLIITSALSILLIYCLPIGTPSLKLALTIASCSPSAMNTALFSQVYGNDYGYGSRLVLLTTILSLLSLPLMMGIASQLYLH